MNDNEQKTALFANLIEIQSRVLLKNNSEDVQIPEDAIPPGMNKAQWVREQVAAALGNAVNAQALMKEVA
jgi:hypothetical protein